MKHDEGEETTAPALPASRPDDRDSERAPADTHALVPELAKLLEQLNETELRTLMLTVSADARTQLPGAGVSLASIALHSADFVVQRNGLDTAFFGRLLALRPRRRPQIEGLARMAGVPTPLARPIREPPPPPWRKAAVAAAVLLGLAGVGVGVRVWVYPKQPTAIVPERPPDPPAPESTRARLEMFPAGDDHRPVIRVKLEADELARLTRPVRRTPAAPKPRPARPSGSTVPPPPAFSVGSPTPPSNPKVRKDSGDPTDAGTIERRVADLLTTAIPLLRFQAATGPEPAVGVTLWLRARTDGQPWPRGRVELRAELAIDGVVATGPQVLCTFEPSGTRSDQDPLEQRFDACADQVEEQVARWDEHIDALVGRVPFMTRVAVDRTRYVSTQFLHANLTRSPVPLPGAAFFAVVHDTIGALPFRVCATEQIGGYLTSERDLGRECLALHDAAGTYAALPEFEADRIFLTHWRGGR